MANNNKITIEASADMMALMMETGKRVRWLELRLDRLERVNREALERQTIRNGNGYKSKNERRHPRQDSPADDKQR